MAFRYGRRDATDSEWSRKLADCGRQVIDLTSVGGGCPDKLIVWPHGNACSACGRDGGMVLDEFKVGATGRLNPRQRDWHASYRGPAGTLFVVRTLDEALRTAGIPRG